MIEYMIEWMTSVAFWKNLNDLAYFRLVHLAKWSFSPNLTPAPLSFF